jgi:hypothetical protein
MSLLGLIDQELADALGISHETLAAWKLSYPEFRESITRGKIEADARVAEKLYHRACGYSREAVKIFMPAGAEAPVYAPYTEHHPPDTQAAASLWLRNRQPAKWRDRQQIDVGGTIEHRIAAMTPEERAADARAFADRVRQALIEARRARDEQRTIEGEATQVEE